MRKSLGDKRREIPLERSQDILRILSDFKDGETRKVAKDGKDEDVVVSRIFPTTTSASARSPSSGRCGSTSRPAPSASRGSRGEGLPGAGAVEEEGRRGREGAGEGRALQEAIRKLLRALPGTLVKDRDEFERLLDAAAKKAGVKLPAPARKAILSALSERDETADICRDKDGNPEPDPELRDTENVPLAEHVEAFFEREVRPHVPDAWIDTSKRDPKDGQVGLVGYEINFNRYFYRYTPPRPLEEIEAEIRAIEQDILRMLAEVTGGPA